MGACKSIKKDQNYESKREKTLPRKYTETPRNKVVKEQSTEIKDTNQKPNYQRKGPASRSMSPRKVNNFKTIIESPESFKKITLKNSFKNLKINEFLNHFSKIPYDYFKLEEEHENFKRFSALSKITKKALKIIQYNNHSTNNEYLLAVNEAEICHNIENLHIYKHLESYVNQNIFNVIDNSNQNETLQSKLNIEEKLGEFESAIITYQLLSFLNYIKTRSIVHRNLKPKNILFSEFKIENKYPLIQVCDFKRAKLIGKGEKLIGLVGTSIFCAPEVISEEYDESCDIWSVGVILYLMIEGRPPFEGQTQEETFSQIKNNNIKFNVRSSVECQKIIKTLLDKNSKNRITPKEAMNHQWFQNLNIQEKFTFDNKKALCWIEKIGQCQKEIRPEILQNLMIYLSITKEIFCRSNFFNFVDTDNDGKIYKDDLKIIYKNLIEQEKKTFEEVRLKRLESCFKKIEKTENGKSMNLKDFLYYTIDKIILLENSNLFYQIVKNEYNTIGILEFKKIFKNENSEREAILEKILKENPRFAHQIEVEEFRDILKKVINE